MNGNNVIGLVLETVTFPADFTEDDRQKFAGEIASTAGRYLPETDNIEELITDVTYSSRAIGIKFGKHTVKAEKGQKINFTFRLSVWLAVVQSAKLLRTTGYSFPVDLSQSEFWKTWEKAPVVHQQT